MSQSVTRAVEKKMSREQSISDLESRGWEQSLFRANGKWYKKFGEDVDNLVIFSACVDADAGSYMIFIRSEDYPSGPTWIVLSDEELDSVERAMNYAVL